MPSSRLSAHALAAAALACAAVLACGAAVAQAPAPAPASSTPAASGAAPALPAIRTPIFVLNSLDANVSVIDPATWTEKERIPTGKEPHHLYLTPDEKSIIVANALSDSLTFIDPKTAQVQRTVRGIVDPYQLQFSPDMKWFVTAANRLNHVDIYRWDGKEPVLAKRINTGKTPSHLWIDSKSATLYSSMQDSDELIAIDMASQTIKWRVKTGSVPADVIVAPDDRTLFLALTSSDSVEVYDVGGAEPKLQKKIVTGKGAHAFRSLGDGRHVYVSNRAGNTISKIDMQTQQVLATYPAPGGPDCMDLSADGRYILVTSRWAKKFTIVDTQTSKVAMQINVGRSPHGVWTLDHARR